MSATAYQRMRRKLTEQTSVAARMNEEGTGDPYAKTDMNYDQTGVKDTGTRHQEGDPPPYSGTPHEPELLEAGQAGGIDPGTLHQGGEPPLDSVQIREGEEPAEVHSSVEEENLKDPVLEYPDQSAYSATDVRDFPATDASEENVALSAPGDEEPYAQTNYGRVSAGSRGEEGYKNVKALKEEAKDAGVEGYSTMNRAELLEALGYEPEDEEA